MSTETQYSSVASLRESLTSDNPDTRAEAYTAVLNADVQPSLILNTPPDSGAVNQLVEAGVLPAPADDTPGSDRFARMVELLEEIASNTGGA